MPLVSRAVLSWLLTDHVILMHWAMPNLLLVVNIVYCLVPIGYCLLPITYCIRPIGYTRQTDGSQDGCNHKMDAFDKYIYIRPYIGHTEMLVALLLWASPSTWKLAASIVVGAWK